MVKAFANDQTWEVLAAPAAGSGGLFPELVRHRPTRLAASWGHARWRRGDLAEELHAEARAALIVSLLSLCFPVALPAGLFLGWRVRARAQRALPGLVEWVSLPFYVATTGLWVAAALGIFTLGVFLVRFHR